MISHDAVKVERGQPQDEWLPMVLWYSDTQPDAKLQFIVQPQNGV